VSDPIVLTVDQAIAKILSEIPPRPAVSLPLDDARSLTLASNVVSSIDSPPFDKSQMDGFAVRAADVAAVPATLRLVETVTAGQTPQHPVSAGEATRIMTGAPLPSGADAVVPIERCTFAEGAGAVTINEPVSAGAFVIRQGSSMAKGETVLPAGTRLTPPAIGLLAELGRARVEVFPRPLVGILATGDELVPIDQQPGPGQIRNSNQAMLVAQLTAAGTDVRPLGIARDNREDLDAKIAAGLVCDILCLSGGVSAGTLDLVPQALQAAGVEEVFHKVDIKPGKPIWFGKLPADRAADGRARWIFGLPGNPVSSMVCCELFVRTALRRLMGVAPAEPQAIPARLEVEFTSRGDRPTYFPARLNWSAEGPTVRPVDWQGSFDLRATAQADAMILFPPGARTYAAGEQVTVFRW
jgi:molybdopterin molybdotransferase